MIYDKMMLSSKIVIFVILISSASSADKAKDYNMNVTSSGPAVSGSYITFQAQLYQGTGSKTPQDEKLFRYEWRDTVDLLTKTQNADYNTSLHRCFESSVIPRKYRMQVSVFDKSKTTIRPISKKELDFTITSTLNGNLKHNQTVHRSSAASNNTFSTSKPIHFVANLTDKFRFAPNFTYEWFIDGAKEPYTAGNIKNASLLIQSPGEHTVRLEVVAPGITIDCDYEEFMKNLKGSFQTDVLLKDPVLELKLYGKTVVNKGEEVTLDAVFNGSAPYSFCWKLGNSSGMMNQSCTNITETPVFGIHVPGKSLSEAGKYSLTVYIENAISVLTRQHSITVKEVPVPRKPSNHSAADVLIPVLTALVVISLLLFGGVFYVNYRRKKLHHIEAADFQFHGSIQNTSNKGWFWSGVKDMFRGLLHSKHSNESWGNINNRNDSSESRRGYGTMVSPIEA